MKIRIRARARQDLDTILEYGVAEYGEAGAEAYLRVIDAALARLSDYPEIGLARPELAPELRSLPAGEHRIFYLLLPDRISVVRVLHKAMDVERRLWRVRAQTANLEDAESTSVHPELPRALGGALTGDLGGCDAGDHGRFAGGRRCRRRSGAVRQGADRSRFPAGARTQLVALERELPFVRKYVHKLAWKRSTSPRPAPT